jgi:hypothetical protein
MATYSQTILATAGLVAYYRLGEASGTDVVDSSGGGRNLVNSGATVGATGLLTDDVDTAYSFDGSNDFLELDNFTPIDFTTADAVSVEAWIKPTTVNTYDFWLGMNVGAGQLYRFGADDAGSLYWDMGQAVDRGDDEVTPVLVAGTTYHIVFTGGLETGQIKTRVYLNGALATSLDEGIANLPNVDHIMVGRDTDGSHPFHGIIDELAIYNTVLTPAQVAAHYNIGFNGPPSGNRYNIFQLRPIGA